MAWWLEGVTSRHFGWVRNPSEAIFSYFLSQGTKRKNRKISDFSAKNRKFQENIGKIGDFSRFFAAFFSSNFFQCKFFRSRPKIDFSAINRPKNPIFCSLVISMLRSPQKSLSS